MSPPTTAARPARAQQGDIDSELERLKQKQQKAEELEEMKRKLQEDTENAQLATQMSMMLHNMNMGIIRNIR